MSANPERGSMPPAKTGRANILGVGIHSVTLDIAVDRAIEWMEHPISRARYGCFCTVHSVIECRRIERVRTAVNRADLAAPDGMPLVWLARAQGFVDTERVYGPDFLLRLFQRTGARYRHYFYGGVEGVAEQLAAGLRARYGPLNIVGTMSPPFGHVQADEDDKLVDAINTASPDVVWVGLSTPKQNVWAAEHANRLNAKAIFAVGAAFDFHSGRVRQAPVWMQTRGLEWLFRLCQEPRRLWRRYLLYNPLFITAVALHLAGLRHYELPELAE